MKRELSDMKETLQRTLELSPHITVDDNSALGEGRRFGGASNPGSIKNTPSTSPIPPLPPSSQEDDWGKGKRRGAGGRQNEDKARASLLEVNKTEAITEKIISNFQGQCFICVFTSNPFLGCYLGGDC